MVSGRGVSDQNIGFEGDAILPRCTCSLILESANNLEIETRHRGGNSRKVRTSALWNIGRAIEIQLSSTLELQRDSLVLEVVETPEIQLLALIFRLSRLGVKIAVMVACDDNLLSVRKRGQPVQLLLYLFNSTSVCQISRVN